MRRMPASTAAAPSYVTVRSPSNVKPSTGVPSGASALHASIPTLGAVARDRALLARQQVDHVVGDDADRSDNAHVPQNAAGELELGRRQVEERREVLGARHDVAIGAADIEQKEVVRERVERRAHLAVASATTRPSRSYSRAGASTSAR